MTMEAYTIYSNFTICTFFGLVTRDIGTVSKSLYVHVDGGVVVNSSFYTSHFSFK